MPFSFRTTRNIGLTVMAALIVLVSLLPIFLMQKILEFNLEVSVALSQLQKIVEVNALFDEAKEEFDQFVARERSDVSRSKKALNSVVALSGDLLAVMESGPEREIAVDFMMTAKRFKAAVVSYAEEIKYDPAGSTAIEMRKIAIDLKGKSRESAFLLVQYVRADIERSQAALRNLVKKSVRIALAGSIIGIVSGFLVAFFMARALNQPFRALTEATRRIGRGDLDYKIKVDSQDEIGLFMQTFNKMADDLKKTTGQLSSANVYVENILKNMNECLVVITPNAVIKNANDYVSEIFGYQTGELIGKPYTILLAAKEGETFHTDQLKRLLTEGRLSDCELKCVKKDGTKIIMLLNGTVIYDEKKMPQYIICVMMDITKRKEIEEEIRQNLKEMQLFYDATIGRENRMIELKKEVNRLSKELGRNEPYDMTFL